MVHSNGLQALFTGMVYEQCSCKWLTDMVYGNASRRRYTKSVHDECLGKQFTAIVYIVRGDGSRILFTLMIYGNGA